jgi:hypothetical protein
MSADPAVAEINMQPDAVLKFLTDSRRYLDR